MRLLHDSGCSPMICHEHHDLSTRTTIDHGVFDISLIFGFCIWGFGCILAASMLSGLSAKVVLSLLGPRLALMFDTNNYC